MYLIMAFVLSLVFALPCLAQAPTKYSCRVGSNVYSFKLGHWDAFVINDGQLGDISTFFNVPALVVKRSFEYYNGPTAVLRGAQNVLVLRDANDVMAFDTGSGLADLSEFDGNGGQLLPSLKQLGINAGDVTKVFLTHAHGDHTGGLIGANDTKAFPNAMVYINRIEHEFWLQSPQLITEIFPLVPPFLVIGTTDFYGKVARIYRGKIVLLNDLENVGKIQLVLSPGHTPGHSAYRIRTQNATSHVVVGDSLPSRTTAIQHPEWNIISDTNRTQAIQTRYELMGMLADEQTTTSIYHQAFPGLGYIIRDKYTFDFSAITRIFQN